MTSYWYVLRYLGAFVLLCVVGALAGCDEIKERYAPRKVTIPTPVGASQPNTGTPLQVSGNVQPVRAAPNVAANPLPGPEFYPGNPIGQVRPPLAGEPAPIAAGPGVTLNFVDTDIREVVHVVFSDTLGLNYVIDPRIAGQVTARTRSPIQRDDVLGVMQNILAANGAGFYVDRGTYHVVPLELIPNLPRLAVEPGRGVAERGIGTYVIPIRHGAALSIHKVASEIISTTSKLGVNEDGTLLIFTGSSQEANAVSDLVSTLDIDALGGLSFALVPVKSTSARDIADEMEILLRDGVVNGIGKRVRFLAIDRMNAVLVVANRPEHLRPLSAWIRRLDRSNPSAVRQPFVYHVRNGRASDLSKILADVFGVTAAAAARTTRRRTSSPAYAQPIGQPLADGADQAADPDAQAAAQEVSGGIETALAQVEGDLNGAGGAAAGLRFVPHDTQNTIIVMATLEEFEQVEAVLNRIDQAPVQVFIEATIAEVSLTDNLRYGLQWAFERGNFNLSLSSAATGAVAPAFPGFNAVFDTPDIRVVLNALSAVTDVKVVSSPQLMVLNNQPARLQVGDQVPVATQSAVSVTDPDAPIVNSVGYFDTGVILTVTPRVSDDGTVILETELEVSDAVATISSAIDSPTIQQRSIATNVLIQSGQTVALGGLIRENARGSVSGVPVLQDIPLLGNAFKTTGQEGERTELLILLTPRIIQNPQQAREITNELRQRLGDIRNELGPARQ